MEESITIPVTNKFKDALKKYCKVRNISMSNAIKSLVAEELIKNNYLEENENDQME